MQTLRRGFWLSSFIAAALLIASPGYGLADDAAGVAAAPTSLASPLGEGDVAVSGFAGTRLAQPSIPGGVDPVTETVIDPNGTALEIVDFSSLGGPTVGQVVEAPVKLALPANAIGQVFALAFDNGTGNGAPNLYAAATSAYGLQIVGAPGPDGVPVRLRQGTQGAAFMAGQFGSIPGASPGSIYKIDGSTGAVTLFADTAFSGVPNTGVGIGGIAFDPISHELYAADLDTGLIHRFNTLAPGADLGQFDHGTTGRPAAGLPAVADDGRVANISTPAFVAADPSTWGLTQPERRVTALAVNRGRLFYAVADGPAVWSVGLNSDGSFGSDPLLEVQIAAAQPCPITAITFDPAGNMIVAQRGTQSGPFDYGQFSAPGAQVLRYAFAPAGAGNRPWSPTPAEYPIGLPDGSRMGAGGVTLADGYNPDGSRGTACGATLMATGDDLRDNAGLAAQLPLGPANLAGVQINDASLLAPQNVPPAQSAFLAFDPNATATEIGHVGAVAAVSCLGGSASAAPVVNPSASTTPGSGNSSNSPAVTNPAGNPGAPNPAGGSATAPGTQPGGSGATNAAQPLTVSKAATAATCTESAGCSFAITVHNPNQTAVPGPFTVQDVFTAGGAQLAQSKLTSGPEAPWTCVSAGAGGSLSCTNPGPMQPGDTKLNLTFAPGQTGNATDVVNCAQAGGAGAAPVNLPPVPQATLPPPATQNNFPPDFHTFIEPRVGECTSNDGSCDFAVGAGPVDPAPTAQGPLTFKITASLGADPAPVKFSAEEVAIPKGATCQPTASGDEIDCTASDTTITDPVVFDLKVKPALPATGASALVLHVSAQGPGQAQANSTDNIALKDGAPQGGANPDAGVTQQFQGPQCATIPLDKTKGKASPPAGMVNGLSIAKTLSKNPGPCTLNTTCSFDITVTNTTNAAVPGPIKFQEIALDKVTPVPVQAGIQESGPFTCAIDGISLACTDANPLPAGQSLTETVTVPVSADLVGPAGNNCALLEGGGFDPACAQFPAPANPPSQGLTIKKTGPASCAVGAPCQYQISVTNTATTDFPGPVVFTDVGLPNGATIDGDVIAKPSPADSLVCTPTDPSTCTLGGKIPAGQTQPFDLSFTPKDAGSTGSATVQNCAMLEGDAADPSCININVTGPTNPLPQANNPAPAPHTGLTLAEKANQPSCIIGQAGCAFTITATNNTAASISPPGVGNAILSVQNDMDVSLLTGSLGFLPGAPGGNGWQCSDNGNVESCGIIGPVAPGASLPPLVISYTVNNETTSPKMGFCASSAESSDRPCASVALVQPAKLKLDKAPKGGAPGGSGTCTIAGPCDFTITLTNTGGSTYVGQPVIDDNVTPSVVADMHGTSTPDANAWTCKPVTNGTAGGCITNGAITLAPGQSTSIEMDVTPGSTWTKNDTLMNCVSLEPAFLGGTAQAADGKACATYKLDPFNVKIQKGGDQSCQPGADCHFTLTLYNPGPIDHNAPVTISDKLNVGSAPITSINPPLPCAQQPTQVPFTCTSPGNFSLPLGGPPHVYNVTIQLPGGATSYTNCATVGPLANAEANQELGGSISSTSCVTTTMAPKPSDSSGGTNTVAPQTPPVQSLTVRPPQPGGRPGLSSFLPGPLNAPHQVPILTATQPQGTVKITKTADPTCVAGQPCNFTLTLAAPHGSYLGLIGINDLVGFGFTFGGIKITSIEPPLPCESQPTQIPFTCYSAGNVAIADGQQQSYRMAVVLPAGDTGSFQNCAAVDYGDDAPLDKVSPAFGGFAGRSGSCATTQILPDKGSSTGGTQGAGTPNNGAPGMSILKSADQASCTPGALCNFTVTIRNTATSPFTGTLSLHDGLDIAGQAAIASIRPPLSCTTQPQSVPFDCTAGNAPPSLTVAAGQSLTYRIGVYLPPTTATQVTNCIQMQAEPYPLGYLGLFNAPTTACATVQLPPATNSNTSDGGTNGVAPSCFSNMIPDGQGGCQCPPNTSWDGKQCSPGSGGTNGVKPGNTNPPSCPAGTIGIYPHCKPITIAPRAAAPSTQPLLKCPAGTSGTYPNCKPLRTQVLKCPTGLVGSPPNCSCPQGSHLSRSGRSCLADQPVTTSDRCPQGERFSPRTNSCVAEQQPSTGDGGTNFTMGFPGPGPGFTMGFPNAGGTDFPLGFPGRHPRHPTGNPSNDTGGTNSTQQPPLYTCPPSEHYSATTLRHCLPNKPTATTKTPAPTPAPSGNINDEPTFGGCPACSTGAPEVIR